MNIGRFMRAAWLAAMLPLASCDHSERNIIVDRVPFFEDEMPYSSAETDRIISSVHGFAEANGMDFLLARDARDGLSPGDFSATAAGRQLNLKVVHIREFGNTTQILVYAPSAPTIADKEKARAFACMLDRRCRR